MTFAVYSPKIADAPTTPSPELTAKECGDGDPLRTTAAMINNETKVEFNAVRLQQAFLCVNCDVISDSRNNHCIVCGSRSLLPLARVLDSADRVSAPAAPRVIEPKTDVQNNVLVLVSPLTHRARQRALR